MGASRPVYASLVVLTLLVAAWLLTYAIGGARTAAPHAYYLPIVLAAVLLHAHGGAIAGVAAAVLSGPGRGSWPAAAARRRRRPA